MIVAVAVAVVVQAPTKLIVGDSIKPLPPETIVTVFTAPPKMVHVAVALFPVPSTTTVGARVYPEPPDKIVILFTAPNGLVADTLSKDGTELIR